MAFSSVEFGKMLRLHALPLTLLAACGSGSEACVMPPCPAPIALQLDVRSAASGSALNVTVAVSGAATTTLPCNGFCVVTGGPGTYQLDVSAPGYTTLYSTVQVGGVAAPKCGCVSSDTKVVAISLIPAES